MRKRGETLILIKWDAAIRPTRAPRSIHNPHMAISVETCPPRPASTPMEEPAKRIGVPVRIAGPVLDTHVDDVKLKGEDVARTCMRAEGGSMAPRAPNRFVASAEAWWKRRMWAREESRRDQSCVRGVSRR